MYIGWLTVKMPLGYCNVFLVGNVSNKTVNKNCIDGPCLKLSVLCFAG